MAHAHEQRMVVHESVVSSQLDNEMVLLHVEAGTYFGLDPVGARIWQLLVAGKDRAAIRAALLDEYDVDPAALETDVARFLEVLREKGLLRMGRN